MIGHLATRSFGQYDLPDPPAAERRARCSSCRPSTPFGEEWSLPADDLRLWVCLHEIAHHAVLGVPHVRAPARRRCSSEYVAGFRARPRALEDRLADLEPDPSSAATCRASSSSSATPRCCSGPSSRRPSRSSSPTARRAGRGDRRLRRPRDGPHRRDARQLATAWSPRRSAAAGSRPADADRFVERLFGLELTQDRYDRGAAFVDGVVERAGEDGLDRLWRVRAELRRRRPRSTPPASGWPASTSPTTEPPPLHVDDRGASTSWPPASSRRPTVRVGARRRSVGEPGLNSRWPSMPASSRGRWLWPNTTTSRRGTAGGAARPGRGRPAVVDHGDRTPPSVPRQVSGSTPTRVVVVVAEHGVDRRETGQLVEQLGGEDVAGVQDDVGLPARRTPPAGAGATTPAAGGCRPARAPALRSASALSSGPPASRRDGPRRGGAACGLGWPDRSPLNRCSISAARAVAADDSPLRWRGGQRADARRRRRRSRPRRRRSAKPARGGIVADHRDAARRPPR